MDNGLECSDTDELNARSFTRMSGRKKERERDSIVFVCFVRGTFSSRKHYLFLAQTRNSGSMDPVDESNEAGSS